MNRISRRNFLKNSIAATAGSYAAVSSHRSFVTGVRGEDQEAVPLCAVGLDNELIIDLVESVVLMGVALRGGHDFGIFGPTFETDSDFLDVGGQQGQGCERS